MFRFFSKIRYQLAAENKVAKYLRYAIGEIVLVVIGILIALQVNNWNENRKLKITERKVLTEMVKELRADSTAVRFNIKKHEQALNSCKIVLNVINNDLEFSDSLAYHFGAINYFTRLASSKGAYESLKTVGLEIISNEFLRYKIVQYYETSNVIYNKNLELFIDYIAHLQKDFYPNLFNEFKIFDPNQFYKGDMIPLDFEQLKQNAEFKYHLKTLLNRHVTINGILNKLKLNSVEQLIVDCLKEIKNLE